MRNLGLGTLTLALAALASPLVNPASATQFAYCAAGEWVLAGGCRFATLEQCRAYVNGATGYCVPNAGYTSAKSAVEQAPRPRR